MKRPTQILAIAAKLIPVIVAAAVLAGIVVVVRACSRTDTAVLADNPSPDGWHRVTVVREIRGLLKTQHETKAILYRRQQHGGPWVHVATNVLHGEDSVAVGNASIQWQHDPAMRTTGVIVYADAGVAPCKGTPQFSTTVTPLGNREHNNSVEDIGASRAESSR